MSYRYIYIYNYIYIYIYMTYIHQFTYILTRPSFLQTCICIIKTGQIHLNTIDQHVWVPGVVTMASDPRPADQLVRGRCKPHGTFPRGETFARSAARYVAWLRFFRHFGGVIAPKTCSLGFLNDESFSKPQIDRNKNIIYTILEASGNTFFPLCFISFDELTRKQEPAMFQ